MKMRIKGILMTLAVFSVMALQAQEENLSKEQENRFSYDITVGIGRAKYSQTDRVAVNGTATTVGLLVGYKLSDTYSLGSGIDFLMVDANGVFLGNEYASEQQYIRIPLTISHTNFLKGLFNSKENKMSSSTTHTYGTLGIYAGTLLREKVTFIGGSASDKGGWNMGVTADFGAKFFISGATYFGVGFKAWGDLFEMEKNGIERKLDVVSTVNITFTSHF